MCLDLFFISWDRSGSVFYFHMGSQTSERANTQEEKKKKRPRSTTHWVLLLQPLTCGLITANDHSPVQWPWRNALKRAMLGGSCLYFPWRIKMQVCKHNTFSSPSFTLRLELLRYEQKPQPYQCFEIQFLFSAKWFELSSPTCTQQTIQKTQGKKQHRAAVSDFQQTESFWFPALHPRCAKGTPCTKGTLCSAKTNNINV